MSNEQESIPTTPQKEDVAAEAAAPVAESAAPVVEAPAPIAQASVTAPIESASREELYPRADGPVESDRDVPQPDEDDHRSHDEGSADEEGMDEAVEPAPAGRPIPEGQKKRPRRRTGRSRDRERVGRPA